MTLSQEASIHSYNHLYKQKRSCHKAWHKYRFTLQQTQRFRQVYFFGDPQVIQHYAIYTYTNSNGNVTERARRDENLALFFLPAAIISEIHYSIFFDSVYNPNYDKEY